MVAIAAAVLVTFIGGLYFITHHKKEESETLQSQKVTGNGLPPKPEERWRYIKELESRQPGVRAPTEPSAGGEVKTPEQLTPEQRQLLEQMQADMRQQPTQLVEVPWNEQTPEQRQQTLQRQRQAQQLIFFLVKQRDLCVTLRQHCQCGGLNTAHIQGTVIENGEKARGVDSHQPIRFLAAEGRLIQGFIVGAGAQIRKTLSDSAVLHRGNPEAKDRLAAAGHFIHQTEDQFPFTPGITGIDDGIHIGAVHQDRKSTRLNSSHRI